MLLGFEAIIKAKNVPVIILPELLETGPHPCDSKLVSIPSLPG